MIATLLGCVVVSAACGGARSGDRAIMLATTTSTQDSGLLDALIPAFERASGHTLKTIVVGSGQAIELGRRGEVDVVLAHSPAAERALMASGVAGQRRAVMHNDFVLVGPLDDPAGVRGDRAVPAFERIAQRHVTFISRGDDSGTHVFELELWKRAGVEPRAPWYQETGQGQSATLQIAAQKHGYALTDRGTYLATKRSGGLAVMVDGGPGLLNFYHVMDITARAGPRVNVDGGREFADWIVSDGAQAIIAAFGRRQYGRALFIPDADGAPADGRPGS